MATVTVTVLASIVLHGVTAHPLVETYSRTVGRLPRSGAPSSATVDSADV
jgi:hypothetical protein